MKVFISYSTASDQIVALRLQTLAAVYGMTIYVPPAVTRQTISPDIRLDVQQRLQESDVVLAVMMHEPAPAALSEMRWALANRKTLIPIVSSSVPPGNLAQFQPHFIVDPTGPQETEQAIVRFLAEKNQTQNTTTALLALSTLAVALFLFSDTK